MLLKNTSIPRAKHKCYIGINISIFKSWDFSKKFFVVIFMFRLMTIPDKWYAPKPPLSIGLHQVESVVRTFLHSFWYI